MDKILAEIAKKKRKPELTDTKDTPLNTLNTEQSQNSISSNSSPPQAKKYVRRGEAEKERERKYLEEQEADRKRKEEQKRKKEEELEQIQEKFSKKKKTEPKPEPEVPSYLKDPEEVIRRLRLRGEVVTFFGESDEDRAERLKRLEEREPTESSSGVGNEFGKTLRKLEEEEDEDNKEERKQKAKPEVDDIDNSVPLTREEACLKIFRRYLREWKAELDERPESVKKSAQGKIETATYKQTKDHIKGLFKQLKTRSLSDEILNPIHDIAQYLPKREYVRAHDAYLRLAIGNAPWPMGVTMVGIHERSAREKIFSNQVAHVLNDEAQRKYIQSVKRIMTFCQRKHPTDPSKTVG